MKKALFSGSFDPPTNGHLDIIQRASKIFDFLYVGIADNTSKKSLLSTKEKKKLLTSLTKKYKNIEVVEFSGLNVSFAKKIGAEVLIRGLRAFSDFEYEFRMALANRQLSGIETLFLMSDEKLAHIHSSLIKEIAHFGGSLKGFVPPEVEKAVKLKQ
ncbi:MAG TPA: pantetheine-phosphate adenylyltransferase [Chlamydiales bacterium]|nr:pantetheine-phosphate adenylyltransferase [Chlamydiales bacterium]